MYSGRVGKALLSSHAFSRPVVAGTGNWGWVFAWPVTAGTGVNWLKEIMNAKTV